MKLNGLIILVSGPSGVGKKTIQDELIKDKSLDLHFSVSWTTRKPRIGERNDIDYHFVSEERFKQAIKEKKFVEYNKYNNTYYGTPKDNVEDLLSVGHNVLLEIDVNGASKIMKKYKGHVLSFFIAPPSLDDLKIRLMSRGTENMETIDKRIKIAKKELKSSSKFHFTVVNNKVKDSVSTIKTLLEKLI